MNPEALNKELSRHIDELAALHQAMSDKLAAIARLRSQIGKVKTGIGQRAWAEKLMREQKQIAKQNLKL